MLTSSGNRHIYLTLDKSIGSIGPVKEHLDLNFSREKRNKMQFRVSNSAR
jgi:hypothetical protein